jgi:thioredoxin reductase (NADPH)
MLQVDGIFIAIGNTPDTKLFDAYSLATDSEGYVIVDAAQATSIPGVFAAGDITTNSNKFKQTIMSAAEGSLAAHSIHEVLLRM